MKPGDEEALLAGLRALREKTAETGAPASVETLLLTEFRRRQLRNEPNSRRKAFLWIGLAAAAALVLVAVALADHQPTAVVKVQAPPAVPQPEMVPRETVQRAPQAPAPAPARQAKRRVQRPQSKPAPLAQEVATEFLAIPYAPGFTTEDRGQLVRVRLPRESMRSFGLPVNQDRIIQSVKADVLIGEDGIARAIRFVQ